jgi:hypothetical protein
LTTRTRVPAFFQRSDWQLSFFTLAIPAGALVSSPCWTAPAPGDVPDDCDFGTHAPGGGTCGRISARSHPALGVLRSTLSLRGWRSGQRRPAAFLLQTCCGVDADLQR